VTAIGVLALQGGFAAHARVLRGLGEDVREVRRVSDLDGLRALVLPGGESSALLKLMEREPWRDEVRTFHASGGALLGTCAGAILLAREVSPAQPSLGLLDALVERNAYGRQTHSFEAELDAPSFDPPMRGVFIRAPRLKATGPAVEVLARWNGEPVFVREGRVFAATFHPEMAGDDRLHRSFLAAANHSPTMVAARG
jgi:5'-phosphate synthase pdxT subunit